MTQPEQGIWSIKCNEEKVYCCHFLAVLINCNQLRLLISARKDRNGNLRLLYLWLTGLWQLRVNFVISCKKLSFPNSAQVSYYGIIRQKEVLKKTPEIGAIIINIKSIAAILFLLTLLLLLLMFLEILKQ